MNKLVKKLLKVYLAYGAVSIGIFIGKSYFFYPKYNGIDKLNDKIAVVTGGASGIGYYISKGLAERNATVIIASRDLDKCRKSQCKIIDSTSNSKILCSDVDFDDFESIRNFVKRLSTKFDKIDILVNNIGFKSGKVRLASSDYIEKQLKVNNLSPFIITKELLPLLEKSNDPRVITMLCSSYKNGVVNVKDINHQDNYDNNKAFDQSQLLNVLLMNYFNKYITPKTKITFNCVNPGNVQTKFYDNINDTFLKKIIYDFRSLFHRYAFDGAQTPLMLCCDTEMKGKSGGIYYDLKKEEMDENSLHFDMSNWIYKFCDKWTLKNENEVKIENIQNS